MHEARETTTSCLEACLHSRGTTSIFKQGYTYTISDNGVIDSTGQTSAQGYRLTLLYTCSRTLLGNALAR